MAAVGGAPAASVADADAVAGGKTTVEEAASVGKDVANLPEEPGSWAFPSTIRL